MKQLCIADEMSDTHTWCVPEVDGNDNMPALRIMNIYFKSHLFIVCYVTKLGLVVHCKAINWQPLSLNMSVTDYH